MTHFNARQMYGGFLLQSIRIIIQFVMADAHVQQRSEDLFFGTVHVTTERAGQLVAMGQVSYRLVEP